MDRQIDQRLYWEVFNPEPEYETSVQGIAPRLPDLCGKKIGLFWNSKPNGDALLRAIGRLLEKRFENIELRSFNLCIGVGPENIREMAENCDGVISALGD